MYVLGTQRRRIVLKATALSGADRGNAIRVGFLVDHSKPAQRTFSPSHQTVAMKIAQAPLNRPFRMTAIAFIAGTHWSNR
jgi:hypothetical protein